MGTEKFNIIFNDYPESFNLSEHRRTKYWLRKDEKRIGEKLKARIEKGEVIWLPQKIKSKAEALFDKKNLSFIVQNPKAAGTPRVSKINAQLLWESGAGTEWTRQKMRDFLHTWYTPGIIRNFPEALYNPAGHYIQFEYIFYYPFAEKQHWDKYQDYLNHAFVYGKTFEDTLVKLGILPNDSPQYVRGGYARYVDIMQLEGSQDRRLEIKVHFCKNNERIS